MLAPLVGSGICRCNPMSAGGSNAAGTSLVGTFITRPKLSSNSRSSDAESDEFVPAAHTVPVVATAIARKMVRVVFIFNASHFETAWFRGNQNRRLEFWQRWLVSAILWRQYFKTKTVELN
jgi:hypothetical protein